MSSSRYWSTAAVVLHVFVTTCCPKTIWKSSGHDKVIWKMIVWLLRPENSFNFRFSKTFRKKWPEWGYQVLSSGRSYRLVVTAILVGHPWLLGGTFDTVLVPDLRECGYATQPTRGFVSTPWYNEEIYVPAAGLPSHMRSIFLSTVILSSLAWCSDHACRATRWTTVAHEIDFFLSTVILSSLAWCSDHACRATRSVWRFYWW